MGEIIPIIPVAANQVNWPVEAISLAYDFFPPIPGDNENTSVINSLIVDGASNFLNSYSYFLRLLRESEISQGQINNQKATELIELITSYLESSEENYSTSFSLMNGLILNPDTLQKLKTFDYSGLVSSRNLNSCVMTRVSFLLKKGNVKGLYGKMIFDLNRLLKSVSGIREDIKNHISPGIEDLRTIYQQYSDFMQFGYYSSLVFAEIK